MQANSPRSNDESKQSNVNGKLSTNSSKSTTLSNNPIQSFP